MKYLVTGGAGFIGSNFVHYMMKTHPEAQILCVDALTYAGDYESLLDVADDPRFHFSRCSICDREAIYAIFRKEKPDVAFRATIRCRPTRFTVICRSTVQIFSSPNRRLCIPPARIRRRRLPLTFSCSLTAVPLDCL